MDWFLYDIDLHRERVKRTVISQVPNVPLNSLYHCGNLNITAFPKAPNIYNHRNFME